MRIERKDEMNITHNSHKKSQKRIIQSCTIQLLLKGEGSHQPGIALIVHSSRKKECQASLISKWHTKKTTPVEMSCKNARPYDWCQKQNGKKDQ